MKKIIIPIIIVASLSIIYFSTNNNSDNANSGRFAFYYKDGLFYQKNSSELFTGRVIDTADAIIEFDVVKGKKNGIFNTYYLNGQLEKSGYLKNNKNEGEWKYYYPNGQLESNGNFKNDLPEGKWEFYYENGIKKCEGDYQKGKQKGEWIYYDDKGEIINRLFIDNGILIDRLERFT